MSKVLGARPRISYLRGSEHMLSRGEQVRQTGPKWELWTYTSLHCRIDFNLYDLWALVVPSIGRRLTKIQIRQCTWPFITYTLAYAPCESISWNPRPLKVNESPHKSCWQKGWATEGISVRVELCWSAATFHKQHTRQSVGAQQEIDARQNCVCSLECISQLYSICGNLWDL